jgi:hypothetical protein
MKLLTATSRTQGRRASDFTWCVEGELVTTFVLVCGRDEREGPDGGCGCGRAFGGLNSHKSTTTAIVRDLDFTRRDVEIAVRAFREHAGWAALAGGETDRFVSDEVSDIIEAAEAYLVGEVLEIRLGKIRTRGVRAS